MANHNSSPTSLSSPLSPLTSEPGSPFRYLNQGRANIEMDEIVVDPGSAARLGLVHPQPQPTPSDVPLTAAGVPRKKPGRKPGTSMKSKAAADGNAAGTGASEPPKQRKPRKPRDPNAPPIQRKRKAPPTEQAEEPMQVDSTPPPPSHAEPRRQSRTTELVSMRMSLDEPSPAASPAPRRDALPGSMMSILNDDPEPKPQVAAPPSTTATSRTIFDPVRSNYDPVRETMVTRDPYGTGPLGSPRALSQAPNRASASPSIASLVDPLPAKPISPLSSQQSFLVGSKGHEAVGTGSTSAPPQSLTSRPESPSQSPSRPAPRDDASKPPTAETKRTPLPAPASTKASQESRRSGFASLTSLPSATGRGTGNANASAQSKKVTTIVQQDREKNHKSSAKTSNKPSTASSSPKLNGLKDPLAAVPLTEGRSILDFGKVNPGEEVQAPSIVLNIPLNGETNKYVNFMRMAEERYGWDALHPRLAADRERKARIAAASAALEKNGSGRESGDEMSVDLQSDGEGSNAEGGGTGNGVGAASGPDGAPAKPARKKRNFKEDEYDKDDDFVDDSELLWEEQAAASRDGFFVYSGPLIPEVEKPAPGTEGPPKRGRGGRAGRGGARGGTARAEGTGRGRGGGPGSRGGSVARKPRVPKVEKEQRDREKAEKTEKAEREKLAQISSKSGSGAGSFNLLQLGSSGPQTDVPGIRG
ncbi:hypothetical protein VTK73DRAFT_10115 [Phialemonium thermophilum]|uniref:Hpc2-related domain-containing protein n=1 Tax=Phialemonium thermophilum TaxID=223376 RepID=A0ABR3XH93_9PEZI